MVCAGAIKPLMKAMARTREAPGDALIANALEAVKGLATGTAVQKDVVSGQKLLRRLVWLLGSRSNREAALAAGCIAELAERVASVGGGSVGRPAVTALVVLVHTAAGVR